MLKKFSGFNKFIRLNHIDEETLQKAAEFLEIKEVNKGEYFFHEGEPSKFFAGLIKGKISFRKSKIINRETNEIVLKHLYKVSLFKKPTIRKQILKNLTINNEKNQNNKNNEKNIEEKMKAKQLKKILNTLNSKKSEIIINRQNTQRLSMMVNYSALKSHISLIKNKYSSQQEYRVIKERFDPKKYIVKEEELFQAGAGYCFGEWALIYNQPRSASVVTLEDSIFFTLDEKLFSKTFLKCLNNSEHKKKKFAMEHLFPFDLFKERQSSIYKNIIPINCERNQIVFNEGDKADTLYLIYLGTFILERKYKHKNFKVLSLEKGSIVGFESIFEEEENKKYKCTLKLTSYDELGLIFSCNVNKLLPYIINKMKEAFNNNYSLYLKTTEEFYLNNINIQKKMFFKRKDQKDEEQKDNINNKKNKRYISSIKINNDEKNIFLDNNKKIKSKSIKFKKAKQIKMESFPFLKQNINDNSQLYNPRKCYRSKTFANNFKTIKSVTLKNKENKNKFPKMRKIKRLNTFFNYNSTFKNKINMMADNNNNFINNNDKKENNNYETKKYIESYKDKEFYINYKNNINDFITNTDSFSEKIDKKVNPMSTLEMSNNNKYTKQNSINSKSSYKTIKSSFKKYLKIMDYDSKNFEINNNYIKNKFLEFKENLLNHKEYLRLKLPIENDNSNVIKSNKIFGKNNDEPDFGLTPIKNKKYKNNIQKYVNYLLSYKKEESRQFHKNISPTIEQKSINLFNKYYKSEKKIPKSRNINNNEFNYEEYKTINDSQPSYSKTKLFTFNSGLFQLPLMTQIFNQKQLE